MLRLQINKKGILDMSPTVPAACEFSDFQPETRGTLERLRVEDEDHVFMNGDIWHAYIEDAYVVLRSPPWESTLAPKPAHVPVPFASSSSSLQDAVSGASTPLSSLPRLPGASTPSSSLPRLRQELLVRSRQHGLP